MIIRRSMKQLPILLIIFFLLPAMIFSEEEKEKATKPGDLGSISYAELGLNFGTPSIINAALGYWFGPIGLRVSGMYWYGVFGIQGIFGIRFADNIHRRHALALAFGRYGLLFSTATTYGPSSSGVTEEITYLGLVYNLNVKDFFFEIGPAVVLTISFGTIPAIPLLQIGYMYRFIPESVYTRMKHRKYLP